MKIFNSVLFINIIELNFLLRINFQTYELSTLKFTSLLTPKIFLKSRINLQKSDILAQEIFIWKTCKESFAF